MTSSAPAATASRPHAAAHVAGAGRPAVLWIHRAVSNPSGGDAIYDRRMIEAVSRACDVQSFACHRNPPVARLRQMATLRLPPDRAGFGTPKDLRALAMLLRRARFDAIVISHEHLDYLPRWLARRMGDGLPPVHVIAHNVTSSLFGQIFPGVAGRLLEHGYRLHERRALRDPRIVGSIVCLSRNDGELLARITRRHDPPKLAMPGAPPAASHGAPAPLLAEVMLTGSYDWFPKRRDLERFVAEWQGAAAPRPALYVDDGVDEATRAMLGAHRAGAAPADGGPQPIRFGLITDRFSAGHKLKTAAYLMQNCIVLSYADVGRDFAFSPDAALFIRRIRHVDDIARIHQEFAAMPADALAARLDAFRQQVAARLSWPAQAATLIDLLRPCADKRPRPHPASQAHGGPSSMEASCRT